MSGLVASPALADLANYSQDFEGLVQADPAALGNDDWLIFANVFDPGGGYLYGYGVFPAPNGSPGFSSIASGEGGVDQGAQQLVTYSDYNNGDHANGNLIETNVFQEFTVGAADVGSTWTFEFDAKLGDLIAPSTAQAFIKTLDPNNGYALTNFVTMDTHTLPGTWGSYSIQLAIDGSLNGQLLQIGFLTLATNYDESGVVYDNVNFTPEPASLALLGLGSIVLLRRRKA
jgi:hypothetical protein